MKKNQSKSSLLVPSLFPKKGDDLHFPHAQFNTIYPFYKREIYFKGLNILLEYWLNPKFLLNKD